MYNNAVRLSIPYFYHPICKVWIYRSFLCLFVCLYGYRFLRREQSQRRQILHGGSSASKAGNLTFSGTLLPQKPITGRIGQRAGHLHDVHNDYCFVPEHMTVTIGIRPSQKTDVLVVYAAYSSSCQAMSPIDRAHTISY